MLLAECTPARSQAHIKLVEPSDIVSMRASECSAEKKVTLGWVNKKASLPSR